MKAKEYLDKYGDQIRNAESINEQKKIVSEVANDFYQELREIVRTRHIKYDSGVDSVVRELNDKWNAMSRNFKKACGSTPFRPDGFKIMMQEFFKEMKGEKKSGKECASESQ